MTQITIQCRLVADAITRRYLWEVMTERNTPLINELLHQLVVHPDFLTWRQKGNLPTREVSSLCTQLRDDPRFSGQPARFYVSATKAVDYIFKSWLKIQRRLQHKLENKQWWLDMLKSDTELTQLCGQPLEVICAKAADLINQASANLAQDRSEVSGQPEQPSLSNRQLSTWLKKKYGQKKPALVKAAIVYLLKNGCKLPEEAEDPEKFAERRRKVEISIERLSNQLQARLPKGRDLTGQAWLNALVQACSTAPDDEAQAKQWQDQLLRKPATLPFPISFETNEDLYWSKNDKGRICVRLNGLSEHEFWVYCDQRQLHWFQRFLKDQETKRQSKNQHSSGLFTLRSAKLAWQEEEGKGCPWEIHRLVFYCTVDNRMWTAEGTEQARQEKAVDVAKKLTQMQEKDDISETQKGYVKRLESTLERINTPFDRPSKPLYQGNSNIIVGVSMGLTNPATAVAVNVCSGQVLAVRSVRQLLGDDYRLLNRERQHQQKTARQRHLAQKQGAPRQLGTANLGQHVDRLIAQAIIRFAKTYRAGSIAVPGLQDVRENAQATIQAKAEKACPGCLKAQKEYGKLYRREVHQWSYGRLIEAIQSQAAKVGIVAEEGLQLCGSNNQELAQAVAHSAYAKRELPVAQ